MGTKISQLPVLAGSLDGAEILPVVDEAVTKSVTTQQIATLAFGAISAGDPATVYVGSNGNDSTAIRGRSDLPFATLNAAASVALSGDMIRIGVGTFAPLQVAWLDNIWFCGSGKPHVDSETAPAKLQGGTVIQGPFGYRASDGTPLAASGTRLSNLGVDSGSEVCAALYAGVAQDAVTISNVPASHTVGLPQLKGVRLHNVVSLCQSATATVHSMRIENVIGADLDNLETWYGVHGLVVKGEDTNVRGLIATGHQTSGLYLKSDNYAPCAFVNVSEVVIKPLGSGTAGIRIEGSTAALGWVTVSGYAPDVGLSFGVKIDGTGGMAGVNLTNASIVGVTGIGVELIGGTDRVAISQVQCVSCGSHGFVVPVASSRTQVIACEATSCTGDGFNLASANGAVQNSIFISDCMSLLNTGHGFTVSGSYVFGFGNFASGNTAGNFNGTINSSTQNTIYPDDTVQTTAYPGVPTLADVLGAGADGGGAAALTGIASISNNAGPSPIFIAGQTVTLQAGSYLLVFDGAGNLQFPTSGTLTMGSGGNITGGSGSIISGFASLAGNALAISGALADGTYPCGVGGSITITNGVITAIS